MDQLKKGTVARLCLARGISDYLFVNNGVECVFVCVWRDHGGRGEGILQWEI